MRGPFQCSAPSPENRDGDNDSGHNHNHKHFFYTDEYGRQHNSVSRFGPPGYAQLVVSKRLSLDGIFIVIFSRTQANTLRFPSMESLGYTCPAAIVPAAYPRFGKKGTGRFAIANERRMTRPDNKRIENDCRVW